MKNHPMVANATVGIEIELVAASIPYKDFTPIQLTWALANAQEFKDEIRDTLYDDDQELDDRDFESYIHTHRQKAYRYFMDNLATGELNTGLNNDDWKESVIKYWSVGIMKGVRSAGFNIQRGEHSSQDIWAVGDDGYDTIHNLPVLEIRTSILTMNDLPKLEIALTNIADLAKKNPSDLMAMGNTGLHIHVHNTGTGKIGKYADMFGRLAAASYTDENEIWDSQARHDRDFERHSLMNKQGDFSAHGDKGAHDDIVHKLMLMKGPNRFADHITVTNQDLAKQFFSYYDRNKGTNIVSEHPTVEYRYLTSAVLMEKDGPQKVIKWIEYFVDSAGSQVNKSRIRFANSDGDVVTLTRMPGDLVRIDYQGDGERKRIPMSGLPTGMLKSPQERGDQGFQQWWKKLPQQDKEAYRLKQQSKGPSQ